jgi:hypothetical protein
MVCKAFLAVAALWAAGTTFGADCLDARFTEQVQLQGTPLKLNGLGVRKATLFKINVYVAALYVPQLTQDPRVIIDSTGPFQLELQFVRGVGAGNVRDGFADGFAQSARGDPALQPRIATLQSWMGDIRTGERMTFVGIPGQGVEVSFAGQLKGVIPGEDFRRALLSIWLGDHPPNPELKAGLLGGPCR